MTKYMKYLPILLLGGLLAGCAASPIDVLVPTPAPSVATTEYLGHLYQTNKANFFYHSLADSKIEKALVPVRKMELEGLYQAAKGELEIIDSLGTSVSTGVWTGITGLLALIGWQIPRPQEKAKVLEALHTAPPA